MKRPALWLGALLCLHSPLSAGSAPRLFAAVPKAWGVSLQMFLHSASAATLASDPLVAALKKVSVKDPVSLAVLAPLVARLRMTPEEFDALGDADKLAQVQEAVPLAQTEVLFFAMNLRQLVRGERTSPPELEKAVEGLAELRDLYGPYLHADQKTREMIVEYHALGAQRLAEARWKSAEDGFRRTAAGIDGARDATGSVNAVSTLRPSENEPSAKTLADFDAASRALKTAGRHDHLSLAAVEALERLALSHAALQRRVAEELLGALGRRRPAHDLAVLESLQRIALATTKVRVKQAIVAGIMAAASGSYERRFVVGAIHALERIRIMTPDMQIKELVARQFLVYYQTARFTLTPQERRLAIHADSEDGLPVRRKVLSPVYLPMTPEALAKRAGVDGGSLHDGLGQPELHISYAEVARNAERDGGFDALMRTAAAPTAFSKLMLRAAETARAAGRLARRARPYIVAVLVLGAAAIVWPWDRGASVLIVLGSVLVAISRPD